MRVPPTRRQRVARRAPPAALRLRNDSTRGRARAARGPHTPTCERMCSHTPLPQRARPLSLSGRASERAQRRCGAASVSVPGFSHDTGQRLRLAKTCEDICILRKESRRLPLRVPCLASSLFWLRGRGLSFTASAIARGQNRGPAPRPELQPMAPDRDDAERHKKIVYDLAQVLRDDREAAFVSNAWSVRRISWSAPLVTEFVCTLFLVLVATLPHGAMPNPAFAEATTGVVLVTLGASLSGAHYNPALTLAFLISQGAHGAHSRQWPLYMTLQLVAGVCGAACSAFFTPTPDPYELGGNHCTGVGGLAAFLEEPDTRLNPHGLLWTRSLVSSALATFLLCSWVLYTAELAAPPLGTFGPVSVGCAHRRDKSAPATAAAAKAEPAPSAHATDCSFLRSSSASAPPLPCSTQPSPWVYGSMRWCATGSRAHGSS
jgi:glycerol uptake facilitator-like aquaporin